MRRIALAIALVAVLIAPAFAQKAEIEAVNAKWIDFFNKGDFGGPSLGLFYNFECFLIFKFNGLVLGISREQFV